ncbi:MAG: endonuclease/exonuclease/phosphatase family protein [Lentisphaerae bacterium]|nr:endonuclease/exonuclease/phosphatase family protein [Lentisphaerota bacterium]
MNRVLATGILVMAATMAGAEDTGATVRVMSFNVRFGTANDGENHWDKRKDLLLDTIRAFDPDLLGTQETLDFQRDVIAAALPGHEAWGVGREDGASKGEMCVLFFRRDRFEKLDGGHFWLSETPDVAGSKSWDSSLPRMVSWVKLRDRRTPDTPPILYYNTHFDHRGMQARIESSRLLRSRIAAAGADGRVLVTGDFNAAEGSKPWEAFFGSADGRDSPLVDTYRAVHPRPGPDEGTTSGFRAASTNGPRIDWIAVSRTWRIVHAGIDRTSRDGRTPSDHFPVTAVLAPGSAAR